MLPKVSKIMKIGSEYITKNTAVKILLNLVSKDHNHPTKIKINGTKI